MNFDYSYRAFLITCLLFGILFLAFKSINLSKYEIVKEENYNVEYTAEGLIHEAEDIASSPRTTFKVETNRAYNEAEKFISEIENEFSKSQETPNVTQEFVQVSDVLNVLDKGIKIEENPSNEEESLSNKIIPKKNSSKRNSTVSYNLANRKALHLPNPVYTCDTSGKVVINITVSQTGKTLKAKYNKSSSTTSNECLIDAALNYARKADFTTFSRKSKQLGTITYNFPGQQ